MSSPIISNEMDDLFKQLEQDYEPCMQIYSDMEKEATRYLCNKEYKSLLGLIKYAKMPHFRNSKNTKAFFLILSGCAEMLNNNTAPAFMEKAQSFSELINVYQTTILLLRRLELLNETEPEFQDALIRLTALCLSPSVLNTILTNELFEQKTLISIVFYKEIISNSSIAARMEYINLFSTKYPDNYWSHEINTIIKELENEN